VEEVKNKKRKNLRRCEGCNEDNPLTLFNKGDLNNVLDFYYRQSWNKGLEKYSALRHGYSNLCLEKGIIYRWSVLTAIA